MHDCDDTELLSKKVEEIERLQSTIKRVLSFLEKVTRPAELPLSKVAFIKGDFIHTNEFIIDDEDNSKNLEDKPLLSHTETADILKERLTTLKAEIANLNGDKEQSQTQKLAVLSTCGKSSNSSTSFLEIREFVDEEGREIDAQVVNMSEEMNDVAGLMEKLGMKEKNNEDSTYTKGLKSQKKKAFEALEEKMKSLGEAQEKMQQEPLDPETKFAYEMHSTPPVEVPFTQDLSFLDDLVEKEANNEAYMKELRTVEENRFGSGFKSGFLGVGGRGKKGHSPKKKMDVVAIKRQPAGVEKNNEGEKRPVAFGQVVVERNI